MTWDQELHKTKAGRLGRESLGSFLVDLEGDTPDDEAFLRVCRDTGRREDLAETLLKLGRVEEAAAELRRANSAYELTRLAALFVRTWPRGTCWSGRGRSGAPRQIPCACA
jgi:hypothetical protein